MTTLLCLVALCGVGDEPYYEWSPRAFVGANLPDSIGQRLGADELAAIVAGTPIAPFADTTCGVRTPAGALWLGSPRGLMHLAPGAAHWRLFQSRRWLPDNRVENVAAASDDEIVVSTPAGNARLVRAPTTLDEKMATVNEALRTHHLRDGQVGEINVAEPGRFDGVVQPSNDNDGLWTSLYVAAETFRYAATGDEQAKRNARQSLDALLFLEKVTGIPGFVARSFVPIEDDPRKYGGEWHRSADNRWWWKGDTSSDELDGHYFAYALYYDLAADEAERVELRGVVERITDHILDHGLYYVGPPGKPTTWGVWAPEKLNHDLEWLDDRGLNSLEILSHLKVAEHMSGKPRYAKAARELIERESYEINTVEQKIVWPPRAVNHSDDELAFLAYYPLLAYERDPRLREVYLASITRSWRIERPERSPFFNFIYAAALQANEWTRPDERPPQALVAPEEYDRDACVAWFRDAPADTFSWPFVNSGRRDVGDVDYASRAGRALASRALPPSERRVMKWNGDPYELDGGGDGRQRDDGAFILLPYWMGRYHRFLD